jgi:hypothetical protein
MADDNIATQYGSMRLEDFFSLEVNKMKK